MDRLTGALTLKTVDFGSRVIAGYAAYHSNVDRVADIIEPGASVKAVRRLKSPADVGVFIGHDMSRLPVGVPIKIEAHPEGLYVETKIFEGPTGDDLLGAARGLREHGQSLGMSIGYRVHEARPDRVNGKAIRRLTDYSLHEYSFAASQAIANPAALVTGVKMTYTVEEKGGRFHVMKAGESLASYDTEDAAKARCDMLNKGDDAGKTMPNALPDSAFLYVQPGGVLDDEGKTVPRTLRHFRVRGADGALDREALAVALTEIPASKTVGLDEDELTRLRARARRMAEALDRDQSISDEPAAWKTGLSIDLLTVAYGLIDAAEAIVEEQAHRVALGEDVKSGWRTRPVSTEAVKALAGRLGRIVEHVDLVAQGKDEEALADWWRAQFDLMEVAK